MKVIIAKDYHDMSVKAASFILEQVHKQPASVLGLATGSTPLGVYKELVKAQKTGKVDFSHIVTFNLDEYYPLNADDPHSFHTFMHQNFFRHIPIKKENIHLLNGETKDIAKECMGYEQLIAKNPIGLQILGIGANGHIGFNEPGSSFESRTREILERVASFGSLIDSSAWSKSWL